MNNIDDIKKIAKKCLKCENPGCVSKCPLSNPIPAILKLICEDKEEEAASLLFSNTNAAPICSRLCDYMRQCYFGCILYKRNEAIPFYEVEKYLSDNYKVTAVKESEQNERVAIIGSGISGISCAIDLAKKGYKVSVFEKRNQIGGVLTESLPSFRFSKGIIENYLTILKDLDVEVNYNKGFGENLLMEDLSEFKYIIMALGTSVPKRLFNGEKIVIDGLDVLKEKNKYDKLFKNKRILVIGGGNVAMDVARTIKRLDGDVHIVYRRDIYNAPASRKEIIDALHEGVIFDELLSPVEVINKENKYYLKVEKTSLVEDVSSSRKKFVSTGIFDLIESDYIVLAIGLDADYKYLNKVLPELFDESGWVKDQGYVIKNDQVIFITGDYLIGASNFAKATNEAKKTIKKMEELKWM